MRIPLLTVSLRFDHDLVTARQRARIIAAQLGFDTQDQSRIATAVSELARNTLRYAGGGRVAFSALGGTAPQLFEVEVTDAGPGIPHLQQVLNGSYRSRTGMGLGLTGTRRLMDQFSIESTNTGTTVRAAKLLPPRSSLIGAAEAQRIVAALLQAQPDNPLTEVEQQNRELLRALDELRRRQDELTRLNRELEDTNRGVVALYAELDEKADHLRRADELKSKFLSNMTHEFRTPVSSILAISRILLDQLDGPLSDEQHHQVRLIQRSAESLSELVNDLLDLAKVEAGKIVVRPGEFSIGDLFAALRGMLRPLLLNQSVALVFDDVDDLPAIVSDEGKISQVLRNFISNALKFTERGEVRVGARRLDDGRIAMFVTDTGIGIAPEHLETIFEEFSQLEHPVQRKVRGTGLGLPLSRKLARLLGGDVSVESTPGVGSTFTLMVPAAYAEQAPAAEPPVSTVEIPGGIPLLIVEDAETDVTIYRSLFRGTEFDVHVAGTTSAAMQLALRVRPAAIVLDVQLGAEHSWHLLTRLKDHPDLGSTPVFIVSAIEDVAKGLALGASEYLVKPIEQDRFLARIRAAVGSRPLSMLLVEDDDSWRCTYTAIAERLHADVTAVASGSEALMRLKETQYDVVSLDLGLPDIDGFEVLDWLTPDRIERERILVVTGSELTASVRSQFTAAGIRILAKHDLAGPEGSARLREVFAQIRMRLGVVT